MRARFNSKHDMLYAACCMLLGHGGTLGVHGDVSDMALHCLSRSEHSMHVRCVHSYFAYA